MNASGIVMPIRCTMPFPGRTTSRAKYDITPLDAIAAPAAGRARSCKPGSRRRRAASARSPAVAQTWPPTEARSWASFTHDWRSRGSPGIGQFDIRSRRRRPAAQIAIPDAPSSGGTRPAVAEAALERGGEADRAEAERPEAGGHHARDPGVRRGQPADVLVRERSSRADAGSPRSTRS